MTKQEFLNFVDELNQLRDDYRFWRDKKHAFELRQDNAKTETGKYRLGRKVLNCQYYEDKCYKEYKEFKREFAQAIGVTE